MRGKGKRLSTAFQRLMRDREEHHLCKLRATWKMVTAAGTRSVRASYVDLESATLPLCVPAGLASKMGMLLDFQKEAQIIRIISVFYLRYCILKKGISRVFEKRIYRKSYQ